MIDHTSKLLFYERRIPKRIANSRAFCLFTFPRDRLLNMRKATGEDAETIYLYLPMLHHRYLYQVLYFFDRTGHPMKLIRHETLASYANLYQEGRLIYRIPNLKVVPPPKRSVQAKMFVTSKGHDDVPVEGKKKRIIVSDDVSCPNDSASVLLPYAAHPLQYQEGHMARVEAYRNSTRKVRIFFSGATWHYDGRGDTVAHLFRKLTRLEALHAVRRRLNRDEMLKIDTPAQRQAALHGDGKPDGTYTNKLVLSSAKGPHSDWLSDLSRCDFFLCLPGMTIPTCHSAVEALAVGAIPILNYPEWLSPPLTHGENCLTYAGEDGLIEAIEKALSMDADKIAAMRKNVTAYYDAHLDPKRVMDRVMDDPRNDLTLYIITERRAAYRGLNADSVLFADHGHCLGAGRDVSQGAEVT